MKTFPHNYEIGSHEYHKGFLDCAEFIHTHDRISEDAKAEVISALAKEVFLSSKRPVPTNPATFNALEKIKDDVNRIFRGEL